MECSGANVLEVETALTPVATLDEVTQAKMVKLPKPKVSHARTCIMSIYMAQMVLLDQIDPRRLKLKPENKADCYTHSCKHCSNLLKIPWKLNISVKKVNHIESHRTVCAMIHLKRNCAE